jgi:hypothetical protein
LDERHFDYDWAILGGEPYLEEDTILFAVPYIFVSLYASLKGGEINCKAVTYKIRSPARLMWCCYQIDHDRLSSESFGRVKTLSVETFPT